MSSDDGRHPVSVRSFRRGLAVIRAFGEGHESLTLSDVARASDQPRASCRRALLTLVDLGYVGTAHGRYWLRPRVLELGYAYLSSIGLPQAAEPHLERLVSAVNESSSIAVLDGTEIVYIARIPTRRIMSVRLAVGARLPAYATSMGRVLLAGLPDRELDRRIDAMRLRPLTRFTTTDRDTLLTAIRQVRTDGYAIVDQEFEEELRSLAVPIRDRSGTVAAALNISAHANRGSVAWLRTAFVPFALKAASAIEAERWDASPGDPTPTEEL